MIDQLNISNFMTFEKLEIPTLKRINLIGGKNNSGKTTLLDAIRILKSEGASTVINNILKSRGSYREGWGDSYYGLFNSRSNNNKTITINGFQLKQGISERSNEMTLIRSGEVKEESPTYLSESPDNPRDELIYVPFQSDLTILNKLWRKVVLTPLEDDVLNILRETIEPRLIRFDINNAEVRVRLDNSDKPVSLKTLGDGVNRMLLTALSLANAKDSILLIDEIELGLHYSAMEKLWGMIFKYAKAWNIQVFATTHSQDAIKTFHYIASDKKYIEDAEYIRLQVGRNGGNEAIVFDGDRLRDSLDLQLEIR